jgi:hypothetical protein
MKGVNDMSEKIKEILQIFVLITAYIINLLTIYEKLKNNKNK